MDFALTIASTIVAVQNLIKMQGVDKTIEDLMTLYTDLGYEKTSLIIYILIELSEDKDLTRKILLLQQVMLERELKKEIESE